MATDAQRRAYAALLDEVEEAVDDAVALGAIDQRVDAADLDDADRLDLVSRIDQYRGDLEALSDPGEQQAQGIAVESDADLVAATDGFDGDPGDDDDLE